MRNAINNIKKAIEIKNDDYNFYLECAEIKKLLNDESAENDLNKAYHLLKNYLSDDDYVEVLKVMSFSPYSREFTNDYVAMYLKINNNIK